jgi:hypothetical protein
MVAPKKGRAPAPPRVTRKSKGPNLFEGENHGVLWVPGRGFQRASYMGPGTQIIKRIQRGDKGKTPIDQISKLHDIDYTIASGLAKDEQEHAQMGREADQRMINNGWKAYKEGKENIFNLAEGAGLIKAKTLLEDWGLMSKTKFLSKRTFSYQVGAAKRDASEYELLLRARHGLVCGGGVTGDQAECDKTNGQLSTI